MAGASTYWDRLAAAMGLTVSATDEQRREAVARLARKLGVSYQAVDKYRRGTSGTMSAENNLKAARHLQVNPDWLASGDGDMRDVGRAWPFGLDLTPQQWAMVPEDTRRHMVDLALAALARSHPGKPREFGT